MPQTPRDLPSDVVDALQRGDKIAAIQRLRKATGLGLKEAKDAVEAYGAAPRPSLSGAVDSLPASVVEALQRGDKIEAIRRLRASSGLGLKESKEAIERAQGVFGPSDSASRTGRPWVTLLILVAVAVAAYVAFRAQTGR